MATENFFTEKLEQSTIKSSIVNDYFYSWAKILISKSNWVKNGFPKILFFDLFSGPGVYEDKSPSTPIKILKCAIENPEIGNSLATIFNDAYYREPLEENILALQGIEKLKFKPVIYGKEADDQTFLNLLKRPNRPATLAFIDPFGYAGVSKELFEIILSKWGSEIIFFFNYRRINAAIDNPTVQNHMVKLFGEEQLIILKEAIRNKKPKERENIILQATINLLKSCGTNYVKDFKFWDKVGRRTGHYILYATKHPKGLNIMKEVMAKYSQTKFQGVATFEFNPSERFIPKLGLELDQPLNRLADQLHSNFKTQTLTFNELFFKSNPENNYVERDYKNAVILLENQGRISCMPSRERRIKAGKPTIPKDLLITFTN